MQILRCHLIKPREIHSGFSGYSGFSKIYEMEAIEKIFQFRLSNFKTENNILLYRNEYIVLLRIYRFIN